MSPISYREDVSDGDPSMVGHKLKEDLGSVATWITQTV